MSKFIRLLACLFTFVFIGSAYGAGYMCNNNKKYTACADRYYPSQCGSKRDGSTVAAVVGGSCLECPSGHTCSGSNLNCPLATNISVTCSAGKYIKSGTTTCSQSCPAGKYCTAGTFTIPATGAKSDTGNIYNCPSGYTSDAGAQANTWCYVKCAPGTRVVKAGGTCTTPAGPWYMWATTVFYGNVSHVVHCMNGFTNTSTSAANHTEMGNCTRSVSAGQYIASGFQQARYIRVSTSGNSVNSAGLHVAEIQAYSDRFGNGTNYLAGVKTGTGTNLGNATDGNWKRIPYAEGGSTLTWDMGAIKEIGSIKLALYADGRTYRAVTVSVSTNNSTWTTVMAPVDIVTSVRAGANETVDPEWIILSGSLASCPAGKYSVASTSDLQNPVSSCTACAIGSYSAAGASRCTACSGGKTTTATGQSSCNATCTNATGANIWAAPTWLPNSVTDKCTIESCSTGYVHGGTANSTGASSYTCSVGTYTITLNNNGGSGGAGSVKEVYKTKWTNSAGTTITSVAIPTRSGYVFNGYYTEASGGTRYITNTGALPANTTFVASRTLYAQWTAATCSKGTGVSIATASVSSNRVSCAVTCSTGYSQSGGTNTTTSFTVTGAAGVATVATACKIRTATCSAGYHLAAGAVACSACPAGKYCAGSSTAFSYNASTAQGITGACASGGWSAGGASNSACTTCLTSGNCGACPTGYSYNSATGKTARNQCRIQCAAGTRVASANATCTTPNNSGYTWGWYISQHVVNAGSLSSGISTCSAGYTTPNTTTQTDHDSSADCKAISYTITYNQNSGTGCANSTYTVAAAKTLCTPSRTGYTFGGWFTNSGLTGSAVSSIAAGTTGNKEYWAKWTANSFTVVYDLNNGTGTKPGNKACTYNAACALDAGTGTSYYRAGYVLKGWSTNKAATSGSFDGKNLATSGTVTVYAIWAGCAAGTAKAAGVAAATACSTCAAGTYTSVAGQASCAACPAGKYCTGGTNVTNCGVGTHRNATGGKTASDCAACSGSLQFQDAAGQTSCKTVSTGYYKASNSAQVQCDAGYRDIAATSRNECVGTFSKTGFVLDPALPTNCASQTLGTATAKTCSYTKKFSGTIVKDCTPENVTKPRTGLSAKAGYYTSGTTSCLACGGNGYYCAGGTASRQTVSAGYYSTGGTETTRTGQSQCTGSTYCTGGVKNNCPGAETDWNLGTGTGWTAVTQCYQRRTPVNCASGQIQKNATSTTAWGPIALVSQLKSKAGYYASTTATSCTICPAGSFCPASATAPTACSTLTGVSVSGGTYSSAAGAAANTACRYTAPTAALPTYCATKTSNTISYNGTAWGTNIYSVTAKPGSRIVNNNTKDATCAQCNAGEASLGGTATACTTCAPGTYSTVKGLASCPACPAGRYCTGGTNVTNCGDGKYRSATGGKVASDCSLCSAITGVSVSGGTYSSAAAATSNTQCKYMAPTPAKPANCATITVNQVTYTGSAWPASTYNVTANAGYHTANSPGKAPTCPANTYTVTYNKNDTAATGTMANSSHTYGIAKALTANGFTNGTKKFLGWAASANGAVAYTNSQSVSNLTTSNGVPVTLYAKWGDCTACAASSGATCSLSAPLGVCTYATNCSAGYTSIVNSGKYNPSCSACAAGTYKGAAGIGACTGCPAGSFCVQGATAPTSCSTLGGGLYRSSAANSKANTACYITTTAGKYVAANTDTAQTTCPNGKYCTAKTLYWPNAGGTETCPAADAAHARTTYPDTYYPYKSEAADDIDKSGTLTRESISAQTWGTGWAGIENCLVVYRIKNAAATFQVEGVAYNATSGKYDRGGSMYYNTVVAGYYLDTVYSETYCNTKSNPMLYRRAIACPAGSYCPGANVPLCSSGTYNSSWGRYACPSGYQNSAAKAGAITSCFSGTKSRPWSGKPTACDKPDGCATAECNDCSVGACNYVAYSNAAGNGDGDIKSGCATNNAACLQTVKSVTASPGYYISGLTCPACGGNAYYCPGGTTARQNVTAGYYSTGGTATTRTGQTKCTGWNYCDAGVKKDCPAAEKDWSLVSWEGMEGITACSQLRNATSVSSDCSAGQLKKNATSSGTWPEDADISIAFQAKPGSIVSGQTCTPCRGAVWSAGGTATACSACPANYGANTATGKTAASQCQTSCAAGYAVQEANKACAIVPSGYQTGTHKVNYGSTTPKAADSTSPAVGTWYSCLTNYSATGSAATNHDARSDCKINCGAGTRIASANATSCTTPSGNWWIGAHTVAAGSASSVSNCNSGYSISGTAATDHDAAADCKISCGGGYYIPTAGGGCKACPAGKYCTGGAKAQTETLAATGNCPAGTYSTGGATSSACTAALSGYTAAVCGANQYSTVGASGCTACATAKGYTNSGTTAAAHAGIASCKASCSGTQYVATAGAGCVTVGGGYYGRQASSTSVAQDALLGRTQCPTGYRDGAAASTESGCIMNVAGGKYVAAAKESAASGTCSPGYAKAAHNVNYGSTSSCAACTGATYAASAGQASCTQCPTATNSTDVTGYAYWNGGVANDHTVREGCYAIFKGKTVPNGTMSAYKCYIDKDTNNYGIVKKDRNCWVEAADLKCNGGYYNVAANGGATQPGGTTLENLWNTACVNVGAGYWSATNALTRTACASGLTTIGYGAGADEAGDCGRVMRFGDSKLYLRSTKKTTPSLNVKIGDKTFYGNMSTSTKGKLRIKKDATTYSVHDDSM